MPKFFSAVKKLSQTAIAYLPPFHMELNFRWSNFDLWNPINNAKVGIQSIVSFSQNISYKIVTRTLQFVGMAFLPGTHVDTCFAIGNLDPTSGNPENSHRVRPDK